MQTTNNSSPQKTNNVEKADAQKIFLILSYNRLVKCEKSYVQKPVLKMTHVNKVFVY